MLDKKVIPIPLTTGPDGKSDPRLSPLSQASVADNVVFDDQESVIIRGGTTRLTLPSGVAYRGSRMYVNRNVPMLECQDGSHWSLGTAGAQVVSSEDGYAPKAYRRVGASTSRILNLAKLNTLGYPSSDQNFDVAESPTSDTYCLAYEVLSTLGTATVRVSVRSRTNDREFWGYTFDQGILGYASTVRFIKPRILWESTTNQYLLFYAQFVTGSKDYNLITCHFTADGTVVTPTASALGATIDGSTSAGAVEDSTHPVVFDAALTNLSGTAVDSAPSTYGSISAVSADGKLYQAWFDSNGTNLAQQISAAGFAPGAGLGGTVSVHVRWSPSANNYVAFTFYATGALIADPKTYASKVVSIGGTSTAFVAVTDAAKLAGATASNCVTATFHPSNANEILVAFTTTQTVTGAASNVEDRVFLCSVNESLAVASTKYSVNTQAFSGLKLAGRFQFSIDTNYFGTQVRLPLILRSVAYNSSIFLWDCTPNLAAMDAGGAAVVVTRSPHFIARLAVGEAAMPNEQGQVTIAARRLPAQLAGSIFYLRNDTEALLAGGTDNTSASIERAVLDPFAQLGFVETSGGATLLAGGCPMTYDGKRIVEEGFHYAPEIRGVTTGAAATAYGPFAVGTYNVYFTEAWTDAAGNWHESAPSNMQQVTIAGANVYATFAIVRPDSLKPLAERKLLFYRTLNQTANTDNTPYLGNYFNSVGGTFFVPDASLPAGKALNLSAVSNRACPPCHHLTTYAERLVASGCGDGTRIYWTKRVDRGFAPEFCTGDAAFERQIPSSFGRVTATADMDSKLIILGEHRIGGIYGVGPDGTGVGEFSDVETFVASLGAVYTSPRSVGVSPEGVWFQSPKGVRLFARGGSLGPHGQEVDSLITGRVVFLASENKEQVWFADASTNIANGLNTDSSLRFLIWDFRFQKFTTFTNWRCVDAVYAGGKYYKLASNPVVTYYDESSHADYVPGVGSQSFFATFETNWVQLAGIQGFQRVYRFALVGSTDSVAAADTQFLFVYANYDLSGVVPTTPEYDSTLVAGFSAEDGDKLYQIRHHLSRHKCEAIKFRLRWTGTTARMRFSALSLELGVKAGINKMAQV